MKKVALLISGGVDSSVALKLLLGQGFEVHAYYLKIWLEDELKYLGDCPWEEDLSFVREMCEISGVPLEVIPFQKEYQENIVRYVIDEVRAGRTPNPDILCNSRIKFGAFCDAVGEDFDFIATGHYAEKEIKDGIAYLLKAKDRFKDQTYFLSFLTQKQLQKAMFPIGHLLKSEVRELAKQWNLPNADRKDSQGICFLGKFRYRDFLKAHLGTREGDFIEVESGRKVGTHEGFWFYTIGQREGIGLSGGPWYVVKKDISNNLIFISHQFDASTGTTDTFTLENVNWISGEPQGSRFDVKIRHGERLIGCELRRSGETYEVKLDAREYLAAGQFAVFYDGDRCLGGGIIAENR
jgi:tRNA-specific 2-thiouridylase